ncbi:MAG TPA: hypothetical protein VIK91_27580, partial [Nannocystis sp.]
ADLWPPTGVDESAARWLASVLTGDADRDGRRGNEALVTATTAARRLADVAASLVVRGDSHHREARALWYAASRLLGFEVEAGAERPSQVNQFAPASAETMNPGHPPADYSARLADMMAVNLALRAERDDARREASHLTAANAQNIIMISTLRSDLDSQTRKHAAEVARLAERIAALESDLKFAREVSARKSEASRRKCPHREDGDNSACDHCSLKG